MSFLNVFTQFLSRSIYLERVEEEKGARDQVKELNPSTAFLFGGQVQVVSQELKEAEELNPLVAPKNPQKGNYHGHNAGARGGAGGSFIKHHRGGSQGPRGRGIRGKPPTGRGDRLAKFKE